MRAIILLCITLWTYPLGVYEAVGRAAETTLELRVCEGDDRRLYARTLGERFLELWRVMRFREGPLIQEQMEVRVPWGAQDVPKTP